MYYAYDNFTGNSISLKTRVRAEVVRSRASARVKCLRKSVSEWSRRANGSSSVLKKSQRLPAIARMGSRELKSYCMRTEPTMELLKFALNDLNLSARAYDRILKVARTIADLVPLGINSVTYRSAGFQPAVSQGFQPADPHLFSVPSHAAPADWKSAIRQVGNLRYATVLPPWCTKLSRG